MRDRAEKREGSREARRHKGIEAEWQRGRELGRQRGG
jgi:hypothetical protein